MKIKSNRLPWTESFAELRDQFTPVARKKSSIVREHIVAIAVGMAALGVTYFSQKNEVSDYLRSVVIANGLRAACMNAWHYNKTKIFSMPVHDMDAAFELSKIELGKIMNENSADSAAAEKIWEQMSDFQYAAFNAEFRQNNYRTHQTLAHFTTAVTAFFVPDVTSAQGATRLEIYSILAAAPQLNSLWYHGSQIAQKTHAYLDNKREKFRKAMQDYTSPEI